MMKVRLHCLLFLLLCANSVAGLAEPSSTQGKITFAVLTDAHIFDDGWQQPGSEPYWYAIDNRTALHWAVEDINRIAGDKGIQFVVYTGDFGLQNVFFSDKACNGGFKSEPGLPPFSSDIAVDEVALELDRLTVREVYIVPGNNDIVEEKVLDGARFDCFISQLQAKLLTLPSRIHLHQLRAGDVATAGPVRLTGLNSASFKKQKENYQDACQDPHPPADRMKLLQTGCPDQQFDTLEKLVHAQPAPLLVFTHIPDLIDPYLKQKDPSRTSSSWDISDETRKKWMALAANDRFLALIAGHFHSDKQAIYATNTGTQYVFVDAAAGAKTWVAPPLAGKNQRNGGVQARGFMLVTIDTSKPQPTVTAQAVWYPSPVTNQQAPISPGNGDHPMSPLAFFGLVILVIVFTGWIGGYLNFLFNKKDDPEDPGLMRNLFLGVCAAALVPLFLHVIGSNLVDSMNGGGKDPDYSKLLVFIGFCLVAAMYGKKFIQTVSDSVLRKAEQAEKVAHEASKKAAQAEIVAERLIEPPEPPSSSAAMATALDIKLSDKQCSILKGLANTRYVLRTAAGLAVETRIDKPTTDTTLEDLRSLRLVGFTDFTGAERRSKPYWYITPEGRQALSSCSQADADTPPASGTQKFSL